MTSETPASLRERLLKAVRDVTLGGGSFVTLDLEDANALVAMLAGPTLEPVAWREVVEDVIAWAVRPDSRFAYDRCRFCECTWWGRPKSSTPEPERHNRGCFVPQLRALVAARAAMAAPTEDDWTEGPCEPMASGCTGAPHRPGCPDAALPAADVMSEREKHNNEVYAVTAAALRTPTRGTDADRVGAEP